jgi:hypothetical protein
MTFLVHGAPIARAVQTDGIFLQQPDNVPIPAVRQNRLKLAPTSCQAFSTFAPGPPAPDVVIFFTGLLCFFGFHTPRLRG